MKTEMWAMIIIAIITIFSSFLIAQDAKNYSYDIAERNKEDLRELVSDEIKEIQEGQAQQDVHLGEIVRINTPSPVIDCWVSQEGLEEGGYSISISNNGRITALLEDIVLESSRKFYRPIIDKDYDSETVSCNPSQKWLSSGETVIQICDSDFLVNYVTVYYDSRSFSCNIDRSPIDLS